jgi:hypothetical protein
MISLITQPDRYHISAHDNVFNDSSLSSDAEVDLIPTSEDRMRIILPTEMPVVDYECTLT